MAPVAAPEKTADGSARRPSKAPATAPSCEGAQGAMPTMGRRLHSFSCRAVRAGQSRPPGRAFTRVAYDGGT